MKLGGKEVLAQKRKSDFWCNLLFFELVGQNWMAPFFWPLVVFYAYTRAIAKKYEQEEDDEDDDNDDVYGWLDG